MQAAQSEMAIIMTVLRILKELPSLFPKNADLVIEIGGLARVLRETGKRYVGHHPVFRVGKIDVLIVDNHRDVKTNKHQVPSDTTYGSIVSEEHHVTTLHSSLLKL